MTNLIRVCHPVDFTLLLTHQNGIKFTGAFAPQVNAFGEHFLKNTNFTFKVYPNIGLGKRINSSEHYDGCLGMIQQNESDLLFTLADYPSAIENVNQGNVFTDIAIEFVSAYYMKDITLVAEVISCFSSFLPGTWFIILLFIFIVFGLIKLRLYLLTKKFYRMQASGKSDGQRIRVRSRNHHSLYRIVTHLTRINRINDRGCFNRFLFISISVASLILVHYFYSLIKTGLVVVDKPEFYRSFDDLIKNDVSISYYDGLDDESFLKSAPAKSKAKILWDKMISKYTERELKYIISNDLNELEGLSKHSIRILLKREVLIMNNLLSPIMKTFLCKLKADQSHFKRLMSMYNAGNKVDTKSFNVHVSRDEDVPKKLKGFIWSKYLIHLKAGQLILRRFKIYFELGVTQHTILEARQADASSFFCVSPPKDKHTQREIRFCIEGIKEQSKMKLDALLLANMKSFMYLIGSLYLLTFMAMHFEHLMAKNRRFRSKRQSKASK